MWRCCDRLYQSCRYYLAQSHIDVEGLNNVEHLYRACHDLGGNGTGTELYSRVKALPIRRSKTMDINIMGITGVAGITVICYLLGLAVKQTPLATKWLPTLCGLAGGLLA